MGETTSRRKHSKAVERTNERVPAPVTENIKQEPSRGRQPRSPRSFRAHKRVNVGQRGIATTRDREVRANGGERERTLASTIFSHNGGVSCRENYDTVSSMQKKKKRGKNKNKKKKKPEPHTCRTPRCFVSRVSRDFHGKRIAAYIRETNMKKKKREDHR